MKIVFKILIKTVLILIILQMFLTSTCQAGFWDDLFKAGDEFIEAGKKNDNGEEIINEDDMKDEVGNIYNGLLILGIVLSVLIGAILGIKFMVGSIEEQVKVKEALVPYVVGCIVIFGAFGIWKLVVTLMASI